VTACVAIWLTEAMELVKCRLGTAIVHRCIQAISANSAMKIMEDKSLVMEMVYLKPVFATYANVTRTGMGTFVTSANLVGQDQAVISVLMIRPVQTDIPVVLTVHVYATVAGQVQAAISVKMIRRAVVIASVLEVHVYAISTGEVRSVTTVLMIWPVNMAIVVIMVHVYAMMVGQVKVAKTVILICLNINKKTQQFCMVLYL